jgi:hypothetical protein
MSEYQYKSGANSSSLNKPENNQVTGQVIQTPNSANLNLESSLCFQKELFYAVSNHYLNLISYIESFEFNFESQHSMWTRFWLTINASTASKGYVMT